MIETATIQATRKQIQIARGDGRRIGIVPTMGALHEGHASLIRASKAAGDFTVVSIFVNPTQFGPTEDLAGYPRPIEADRKICVELGVDLIFHPTAEEMYPREGLVTVRPSKLNEVLCGASRPGHFDGVCTVVTKLLNVVQPDAAYFGQKDAQQAVIIQRMAADLNFPVGIVVCPTVREPDGLAMSSRNAYLSPPERKQALCLYRALQQAESMIAAGRTDGRKIKTAMRELIVEAQPADLPRPRIDYVEIVDPESLEPLRTITGPALIALAVHVGKARLIDNRVVNSCG